jgi:hypothetical protein
VAGTTVEMRLNRAVGPVSGVGPNPDVPYVATGIVRRAWAADETARSPCGGEDQAVAEPLVLGNGGEFFLGALQRSKACAGIVRGQRRGHQATAGQARCLDDRLLPRFRSRIAGVGVGQGQG